MVDREILRLYALRTGLGLKYLSKDEMISVALKQLRPLFPDVIFKGGTALNRVYLSQIGVNRFSEDIDLDFTWHRLPGGPDSTDNQQHAKPPGLRGCRTPVS